LAYFLHCGKLPGEAAHGRPATQDLPGGRGHWYRQGNIYLTKQQKRQDSRLDDQSGLIISASGAEIMAVIPWIEVLGAR
jgi:hypothetical protein